MRLSPVRFNVAALFLLALVAVAQTNVTDTGTLPVFPLDPIGILIWLEGKAPWLVSVIAFIGGFRLIAKPLMTLVEKYVASTATPTDDQFVIKATASPIYKLVAWLLDYATSIKIGPQAAVTDPSPANTEVKVAAIAAGTQSPPTPKP
jgi:hypothetical protein